VGVDWSNSTCFAFVSSSSFFIRIMILICALLDFCSMSDIPPLREDIQRWSLSFAELMADPKGLAWFRKFLRQEFSEENLNFYLACEDMKQATSCIEFYNRAKDIFETFIRPGSQMEVNISSTTRQPIIEKMIRKIESVQNREHSENQKSSLPEKGESNIRSLLTQLLESIESNRPPQEVRIAQIEDHHNFNVDGFSGQFPHLNPPMISKDEEDASSFESSSITQCEDSIGSMSILSDRFMAHLDPIRSQQRHDYQVHEEMSLNGSVDDNYPMKPVHPISALDRIHRIQNMGRKSISSLSSMTPKLEPRDDYVPGSHAKSFNSSKHIKEIIEQLDKEATKRNSPSSHSPGMFSSNSITSTQSRHRLSKSALTTIHQRVHSMKKAIYPRRLSRDSIQDGSSLCDHSSVHSTTMPAMPDVPDGLSSLQLGNSNASLFNGNRMMNSVLPSSASVISRMINSSDDVFFERYRQNSCLSAHPPSEYQLEEDVYDTAQSHVRDLMARDSYPRFLATFVFKTPEWFPVSTAST
jgi:hypothetical protein